MPKKGRKEIKVARSAETGRFVTKVYAKAHPRTTVVETIKPKGGAGNKRKRSK